MGSYTDIAGAREGVEITPSDSATIRVTRGLYVGVSGDVYVDFERGGTNVKLGSFAAGISQGFQVTKIYSTGTTATGIVALY